MRTHIHTAGAPARIELEADRNQLAADGLDLAYITVRIVDKDGNLCPLADNPVSFEVTGAGSFRAAANGDATCLVPFQSPQMPAFSGQLTAIVQAGNTCGTATLTARSDGLQTAEIKLKIK
jgi:beta-galactosidase